jgi:hypothetical protein
MDPRLTELTVFLGIVVLGSFVAAICTPNVNGGLEHLAIGVLFGTLFSHATLAAAWIALGPAKLIYRLPLSLVWLAAMCIGFAANLAIFGGPADILIVVCACLAGQWILTQVPLWGIALGYGIRVRHRTDRSAASNSESQFGIRQLIMITAIIGVTLGIGRAVILAFAPRFQGFGGEGPIFVFIAVAGILMTLPLVLAALLPRRATIAVFAVLALIAAGTTWELPLLTRFTSTGGPDFWHFALMNGFQAAWILVIAGLLRAGGYQLQSRTPVAGNAMGG